MVIREIRDKVIRTGAKAYKASEMGRGRIWWGFVLYLCFILTPSLFLLSLIEESMERKRYD